MTVSPLINLNIWVLQLFHLESFVHVISFGLASIEVDDFEPVDRCLEIPLMEEPSVSLLFIILIGRPLESPFGGGPIVLLPIP